MPAEKSPLFEVIAAYIKAQGSISVAQYMALALSHPHYGYYVTREPLGVEGDFTTSPEISQMFGEIIAVVIAQRWIDSGQPSIFHLIECGPGRGTLMADMLRVMSKVDGLLAALQVHLVEISPVLQQAQAKSLEAFQDKVTWHTTLGSVPHGAFALVANEFLDALPAEQFIFENGSWHERRVGLKDGKLVFVAGKIAGIEQAGDEGDIIERSPIQQVYIRETAQRVAAHDGFAIFIDYGTLQSGFGDTLQAVRQHDYADALENPGHDDLTTHIDFAVLAHIAQSEDCDVKLMTQREFLVTNGIEARAEILQAKNPSVDVLQALHRLTSAKEMGELFKVMILAKGK